jgi:CelD/BcsL family acetyltransferase involved in cellulose biosynthesis
VASRAQATGEWATAERVSAPAPQLRAHAAGWRGLDRDRLVAAWDGLAQCAAEPNPFLESWALLPALEALDPPGEVQILRVEADGDLAGLLPLAPRRRYYGWPIPHVEGWTHPNAFLGTPLVAAGLERAFWRALLAWADRRGGLALFLHLANVALEGPVHRALMDVLAEQGRNAGVVHREERALLASHLSPEDYLAASMTGKKRKELRRQMARLGECGEVAFRRQTGSEGLDQWIAAFLALEAAGWKGEAGSALALRPETRALFAESLRGGAARGRLERLSLNLDGRPIAMLANFVTPPGLFSYKTAFDEDFARFSPGVLLQCENLKLLERPDIAWADSCAAADHPMIDRIWRERRPVGRLSIAIGGPLRRAAFARLLSAELARNPTGVRP